MLNSMASNNQDMETSTLSLEALGMGVSSNTPDRLEASIQTLSTQSQVGMAISSSNTPVSNTPDRLEVSIQDRVIKTPANSQARDSILVNLLDKDSIPVASSSPAAAARR